MKLYGKELDLMLYGKKEEALLAKRRLSATYARIKSTRPEEAKELLRILRKIRI